MQSFSAANVYPCPSCNAEAKRQLQPAGIVFKGSGWYITDSRKEDAERAKKAGVKTTGESGAAAEASASNADGNAASAPATEAAPAASPAKESAPASPASTPSIGPSSTPA